MNPVQTTTIHRAAWVFPMTGPAIQDGAVAVANDRIQDVGPWREVLRRRASTSCRQVDHGRAALLPGLVNVHTHLDWSFLQRRMPDEPLGFPAWVQGLLAERQGLEPEMRQRARDLGRRELEATGTAVYADVLNPPLDGTGTPGDAFPVEVRFVEVLGFHLAGLEEADRTGMEEGATIRDEVSSWGLSRRETLAAHSLYAASPPLIREAKEWTRRRGLPFSIHVAEHPEELEFVDRGSGFCRTLLESLGRWNSRWRPFGTSPVKALESLGVLDGASILVHAVFVDDDDWDRLAKAGVVVCFCPRSNRFISGGQPAIQQAWSRGVRACLATDSRASNEDLNLFKEAVYVLSHMGDPGPERLLSMITLNGARALGVEGRWGRLGPGAAAAFLRVGLEGAVSRQRDVAEAVVHRGAEGHVQWVKGGCGA
ncbi:Cytosine/adenosine deaminase [Desulfacinum hydrothermale DSM 13146]|uniref:Cytosine/adenosine deaminase n=1 Tax=Desulfacinum hydrothermale DSM 13146 TaxID=1121390 RepID=A0A1W1XMQ2_9BACT|nr:amidohydrolase family protein [Desulfacinum hydrothermale]SMC24811.1 Cytosine/adenosine deaminase [Desulfacinum hydrothermale DSM 13146]